MIDLLRPDDLLSLRIEPVNLRLDATDRARPVLVRINPAEPAFLAVVFSPQSIAERAFFDARNADTAAAPDSSTESVAAPGGVSARIAAASRLVFRLPDDLENIPFSINGLLDWGKLIPSLAPLATLPVDPTAPQLDAAPEVSVPTALETSIELPYRLMLSPDAKARWIHARAPITHRRRTELWHTRLARIPDDDLPGDADAGPPVEASRARPVPIRAIWSPDYRPPAQAVLEKWSDLRPFRMSIAPGERHQIVARTVGCHDLIERGGRRAVPQPVWADRLFLSSLGGWLRSRGSWGPPITARGDEIDLSRWLDRVIGAAERLENEPGSDPAPLRQLLPNLPLQLIEGSIRERGAGLLDPADFHAAQPVVRETLDLSEWVHDATLGRDHYVRIVREGRLYPFGHRAALVTVTERRFEAAPSGPAAGAPVAYLRQRQFIVVREPEKSYFERATTPSAREMPLGRRVRITTRVTPNLEDRWQPPSFIGLNSFWVRANGEDFRFHLVAQDLAGREVDFTAALIFVLDRATKFDDVRQAYETQTVAQTGAPRRTCHVSGQKVAFAPPTSGQPEDTTLATTALYFAADASVTAFDPRLSHADVRIPALEQMVGPTASATVKLYQPYVNTGIDQHAGVFVELVTPLGVKFSADKAGGIATPNLAVSGVSRALGPVAGSLANAAAGTFDPIDFFPPGLPDAAKIFGSVPLGDLMQGGAADLNAPKIRVEVFPPAPAPPREMITTFDLAPAVKVGTFGSILETRSETALNIHGRIVAPVGSGEGRTELTGSLTSFDIVLAKVIRVKFTAFRFSVSTGQKPDVGIELEAGEDAVTFDGALTFVNALSKIIPSGVFGSNGPSVDLSPTGLKVGYSLGLPGLPVGVFALRGLRLSAALSLPFLTGKPQVDFAFAERQHPFLLTVTLFGGGGFVHVAVDATGVILVEGALEFGGAFALDLGVATGAVHVMAGIYFKLAGKESELAGFYDLGGEVTALGIVSVCVCFNLTLSYFPEKDKVRGRATLTVAVEIFGLSRSLSLTVEKSFGSSSGDPVFGDILLPADWDRYAEAFA